MVLSKTYIGSIGFASIHILDDFHLESVGWIHHIGGEGFSHLLMTSLGKPLTALALLGKVSRILCLFHLAG